MASRSKAGKGSPPSPKQLLPFIKPKEHISEIKMRDEKENAVCLAENTRLSAVPLAAIRPVASLNAR